MFQNLYVIQKIGAEKVQWAQHFIDRGFQGWWKLVFLPLHPVIRLHSQTSSIILYTHLSLPALEPILKQTAGKYCVDDEVRA